MGDYKLSALLPGHDDDVRGVIFPDPAMALSASRDGSVRLWRRTRSAPPAYEAEIQSTDGAFVNSLAFVPPSAQYPDGLILSSGQDAIVRVQAPGRAAADDSSAMLIGHHANVCALHVSDDGQHIVSGSWDNNALVWQVGKWTDHTPLQGHTAAVWAVLAYDAATFITGCADHQIRLFQPTGAHIRSIQTDHVVRALCKLSSNHASGAHFASAGNDAVVRLWTLAGRETRQLRGHDSFIYALACLPDGQLVTSSEDRTARIWNDYQCVQTITHPAISVWSVAVCRQNGDIVTGASDRIVRIFSRDAARHADTAALQAFDDSVKSSAIPQQSVGHINREKLPGPDFLVQRAGTKEGQVQMINEANGSIAAYQWSATAGSWVNVGTVVDAAGTGRKVTYNGQDYDYVFDVDIEDGKPPLKLPFNVVQNPHDVARKFIEDNRLPVSYLDQVVQFILQNTQGATLGQSSQSAPSAGPGDATVERSAQMPSERPKTLPQKECLDILSANHRIVLKKLKEFNQQLVDDGCKDTLFDASDVQCLEATVSHIEKGTTEQIDPRGVDLVLRAATKWPADKRLPGLDLLRLLTAQPEPVKYLEKSAQHLTKLLPASDVFAAPTVHPNNTMMAVRALSNLFRTAPGRTLASANYDTVHDLVKPFITSSNRNLVVALATLYVNYAVLFGHSLGDNDAAAAAATTPERALTLLDDVIKLVDAASDAEAVYRGLVAAGTLLYVHNESREAARDVLGFRAVAAKAAERVKEPRTKAVVSEIEALLAQ